jgi:hypothetical protein
MALIVKLLKAGETNNNQQTVLYSVSSPVAGAIVNNVRLVNTQGNDLKVNLFVRPSSTPATTIRLLDRDFIASNSVGVLIVKPEVTLGQGDQIEVTTSLATGQTGSAIMDFVVSGAERV